MKEYVYLVAVTVFAPDRAAGMDHLKRVLPGVGHDGEPEGVPYVESWWLADDDRTDNSDNDSAVFCHKGVTNEAHHVLFNHALTERWNLPVNESGA